MGLAREIAVIIILTSFLISSIFKMFSVHIETRSVFEKLRFRDVLAWTVGVTVKLQFSGVASVNAADI